MSEKDKKNVMLNDTCGLESFKLNPASQMCAAVLGSQDVIKSYNLLPKVAVLVIMKLFFFNLITGNRTDYFGDIF